MASISTEKLRHQILKERGLVPPKPKKVKLPIVRSEEEFIDIPLLPKMLFIEAKYGVKIKLDIFKGSLNDVCTRYHWDVDRSTISRWRKYMRRFMLKEVR